MAEYSQNNYRLLVIPDHRQTEDSVDLTTSTFTQYGPRPGVPEAQQDTEMVLESSGSQSASKTLTLRTEKAGLPARDTFGAGFCWMQSGDTKWRGHDTPQAMFGIEAPGWNALAGVRNERGARFPDGVVTPDGVVVAVTCNNDGSNSYVGCYVRSVTGTWTFTGNFHSEASDGTHELHPTVCILPNGRVLCFMVTYDAANSEAQVRMEYSDDDGTTWYLGSRYCLPDVIDTSTYKVEQMRAAYSNGQICLVVILSGTNEYRQYASDSLGADFALVETTATGGSYAVNADVIGLPSGGFAFTDVTATVVSTFTTFTTGSAFQTGSSGYGVSPGGGFSMLQGAQFALDDNGSLYIYGVATGAGRLTAAVSYDEGISYTALGDQFSAPTAIATGAGGEYPYRYSCVFQRGRTLVLHNFESGTGTYDNSFMCSYHGGYSDLTMPYQSRLDVASRQGHWLYDWVPYDLPTNMLWAGAGVAATEALASGGSVAYLDLATAAGNTRTYTYGPIAGSPTIEKGMGVHAIFSVQDTSTTSAAVRLDLDDTTDRYTVDIRFTVNTIALYDVQGAVLLGSAAGAFTDTYYEFAMWVNRDQGAGNPANVSLWYRVWTTDEDREWTLLGSYTTLARGGTTGGQIYDCIWGHLVAGVAESEWVQVSFVSGNEAGENLALGQTNPDDLALRRISSLPVYVDDGVRIAAVDGPSFAGDEWDVSTRYEYPWQNVLVTEEPSPKTVWRSKDGSANQDFVFALDDIAGEGADWENDLFAVFVLNTNAYRVRVDYETTPGGGYTNIINSYLTATCSYTRAGRSVEITRHTIGDDFQLVEDELVGCEVVLDTAGVPKVRHVTRNTYGYVPDTAGTTNKRPRLYCDDIDGTEAASGTCTISWPDVAFVHSLRGTSPCTVRVRLEPNPYTAPSYIQAGVIAMGPAYVFAWQPSETRSRVYRPNVEITTSADGRRSARVLGPLRRVAELTWVEGVDETMYLDGTDDTVESSPSLANAEVVAERHDLSRMLMGLVDHIDGPATPVLYMPKVPKITSTSGTTSNRYFLSQMGGSIFGRVVGDIVFQTLLGEEETDEVIRVGGLRIESEV